MPDYKEIEVNYECTNCGNLFSKTYPKSARIRTVTTVYGKSGMYQPGRSMNYMSGEGGTYVYGETHIEINKGGAPVHCPHCGDIELKIITRKPTTTEE